jgi:hypothetical protein
MATERDREEQQSSRGFKVQDRRRFAEPEMGGREAEEPTEESPSTPEPELAAGGRPAADDAAPGELGEVTFSTFIMGLTTQALVHLGEIADPSQPDAGRDLPAAKQMIDLLGILSDKTKGNLDAAEEQLLGSMLYDLRMRYVEVARAR